MGEEKLLKKLKNKDEYYFVDESSGINVKTKEIYKKEKKILFYPFKPRNGKPKYGKIKKITFLGYDKIPRGFEKSWKRGYGVRDEFYPLLKHIQKEFKEVNELIICKKSMVKGNKLYINGSKLESFYYEMKTLLNTERKITRNVLDKFLENALNKRYLPQINQDYYVPGMFKMLIELYNSSENTKLADEDEKALLNFVTELTPVFYQSNKRKMLDTKESVEKVFIEDVLNQFKELMNKKSSSSLEELWQRFFEEQMWIFSQLLSVPVIMFKSRAYVGGKGFDFKGGKITDFLYQNALTKNLAIIEIKTH